MGGGRGACSGAWHRPMKFPILGHYRDTISEMCQFGENGGEWRLR